MSLFNKTKIPLLGRALDAYSLRQKVIGSNIANATTVGYRSKSVKFDEELNGAIQQRSINIECTDKNHLTMGEALNDGEIRIDEKSKNGNSQDLLASGLNDVDIDSEMAELAKNQIQFKYAARFMSDTFKGLQKSIRGQL
jgi:flagellar basal-body rod protein FlgB